MEECYCITRLAYFADPASYASSHAGMVSKPASFTAVSLVSAKGYAAITVGPSSEEDYPPRPC